MQRSSTLFRGTHYLEEFSYNPNQTHLKRPIKLLKTAWKWQAGVLKPVGNKLSRRVGPQEQGWRPLLQSLLLKVTFPNTDGEFSSLSSCPILSPLSCPCWGWGCCPHTMSQDWPLLSCRPLYSQLWTVLSLRCCQRTSQWCCPCATVMCEQCVEDGTENTPMWDANDCYDSVWGSISNPDRLLSISQEV